MYERFDEDVLYQVVINSEGVLEKLWMIKEHGSRMLKLSL